jgi:ribosomal protein S12 methylthiotransferase accessory factor
VSLLQARASALCEALERVSGAYQGDEARRLATIEELGPEAIAPERWLLFSERQYREREQSNAGRPTPYGVPHRFEPERRISWSPAWSLTHGAWRYLPTALCYYDFQDAQGPSFGFANSNGCAAGNCVEEAILQGFLELVERDAVALWWYNRLRRPAVALESFDEPYVRRLADYYRSRAREFWVLDVTSDLGIPVFAAISRRVDGGPEHPLLGFGAHLDPRVALLRALTELNQALAAESPSPDTSRQPGWFSQATLAAHPYLSPDERQPSRAAPRYPPLASDDLRQDVDTCVQLAHTRGLETVVLDQTRPDIGLTVVRVVVPGLRHFWRRLAPGRLYDVPVQEGWLRHPLDEERLNPHEVTF